MLQISKTYMQQVLLQVPFDILNGWHIQQYRSWLTHWTFKNVKDQQVDISGCMKNVLVSINKISAHNTMLTCPSLSHFMIVLSHLVNITEHYQIIVGT